MIIINTDTIVNDVNDLVTDIEKTRKIEDVLDSAVERTENIADKLVYSVELSLTTLFELAFKGLSFINSGFKLTLETINSIYRRNEKLLRYAGLPLTALIPVGYKLIKGSEEEKILLLKQGLHLVRSRVGGGKSLTSLMLAEYCLKEYGFASYMTSPVEKPQLSEDGKYYYVMHRVINPKDYYKAGKKVMNYNTDLYPYYHKDERHLEYNPRLNKTKEYNATWIPEHEDELLMRHDGFKTIIKYSQHMKLDSQEMENLTFMHEVETKKDLTIRNWLNNGKFNFIPIKLRFTTYILETEFDGTMKRKRYKRWSLPVAQELLDKFDTHAEKHKHAGLPVDYKRK